jgi:hypothetical protein
MEKNKRQYLLGLGLGLIPLLVFLPLYGLAIGSHNENTALNAAILDLFLGVVLYLAAIIAMIACLVIARVRFVGYGLLTAVLVSPIIAVIGCNIISAIGR